ncbi:hypothetical protein [Novosphingobium sp. Gsoil 351]|uniref:hypothetical protein n=1 Tax=Novosphingobium sp. Gsoil 351 TaxID=2675225 RepID=UPI0012B4B8F2|nr:hypothetical protein [Novosphingobium sp. Gsoil 351]QGN54709.1 hypothetical protein GKE62_09245 [Novosphingobium sp. Gsoil 351]
MFKLFAIASILASSLAGATASAAEPVDSGWSEVARAKDGDCVLRVIGNGQFYRIAASGLGSGAAGRMVLANGDMKPLDWTIRAASNGGFARYYLPFRWHREGGDVLVSVATARCALSTSFAWQRAAVLVR